MKVTGIAAIMAGAVALAGCQVSPCDEARLSALADEFGRLSNCGGEVAPTTAGQMPTGGSATYRGVGVLTTSGALSEGMIGKATMTADFGGKSVNGSITNLSSDVYGALGGQVTVAGGTISGGDYNGATVSGALTRSGATFNMSGTSDGAFGGADAGLLFGLIDATGNWTDESASYQVDGLILSQK